MIKPQMEYNEFIFPHLGHIIHEHVSGTFIDFKTSKTPADKKADRW